MYFDLVKVKDSFDQGELQTLNKKLIAKSDAEDGFSFVNAAVFSLVTDLVNHIGELISLEETDILTRDALIPEIYRNLFFARMLVLADDKKQVSEIYKDALNDIGEKLDDCSDDCGTSITVAKSGNKTQDQFDTFFVFQKPKEDAKYLNVNELQHFDEAGLDQVMYDFYISLETIGINTEDQISISLLLLDDEISLLSLNGIDFEDDSQEEYISAAAQLFKDYFVNNQELAQELKELISLNKLDGSLVTMTFVHDKKSDSPVEFIDNDEQ